MEGRPLWRPKNNGTGQRPSLQRRLFQSPLIELDEIEVGLDIFPPGAAGFFQEMGEARFLGGGIGMARNHGLVPMLDFFGRMLHTVLVHPLQNLLVVVELVRNLLEGVALDAEESEQVLSKPTVL